MVWYKSKNTSYQYPKQSQNIYTYIVLYIRRKKKNQKLKVGKMLYTFYRYTCTILISYVKKVKKKKKKAKWLLGFFSNCDVFNYGSKISFLKISIDN